MDERAESALDEDNVPYIAGRYASLGDDITIFVDTLLDGLRKT